MNISLDGHYRVNGQEVFQEEMEKIGHNKWTHLIVSPRDGAVKNVTIFRYLWESIKKIFDFQKKLPDLMSDKAIHDSVVEMIKYATKHNYINPEVKKNIQAVASRLNIQPQELPPLDKPPISSHPVSRSSILSKIDPPSQELPEEVNQVTEKSSLIPRAVKVVVGGVAVALSSPLIIDMIKNIYAFVYPPIYQNEMINKTQTFNTTLTPPINPEDQYQPLPPTNPELLPHTFIPILAVGVAGLGTLGVLAMVIYNKVTNHFKQKIEVEEEREEKIVLIGEDSGISESQDDEIYVEMINESEEVEDKVVLDTSKSSESYFDLFELKVVPRFKNIEIISEKHPKFSFFYIPQPTHLGEHEREELYLSLKISAETELAWDLHTHSIKEKLNQPVHLSNDHTTMLEEARKLMLDNKLPSDIFGDYEGDKIINDNVKNKVPLSVDFIKNLHYEILTDFKDYQNINFNIHPSNFRSKEASPLYLNPQLKIDLNEKIKKFDEVSDEEFLLEDNSLFYLRSKSIEEEIETLIKNIDLGIKKINKEPIELIDNVDDLLDESNVILQDPILLANYAIQSILAIHPFDEGNELIAHLLGNYVLQRCGLPPVHFDVKSSSEISLIAPNLREEKIRNSKPSEVSQPFLNHTLQNGYEKLKESIQNSIEKIKDRLDAQNNITEELQISNESLNSSKEEGDIPKRFFYLSREFSRKLSRFTLVPSLDLPLTFPTIQENSPYKRVELANWIKHWIDNVTIDLKSINSNEDSEEESGKVSDDESSHSGDSLVESSFEDSINQESSEEEAVDIIDPAKVDLLVKSMMENLTPEQQLETLESYCENINRFTTNPDFKLNNPFEVFKIYKEKTESQRLKEACDKILSFIVLDDPDPNNGGYTFQIDFEHTNDELKINFSRENEDVLFSEKGVEDPIIFRTIENPSDDEPFIPIKNMEWVLNFNSNTLNNNKFDTHYKNIYLSTDEENRQLLSRFGVEESKLTTVELTFEHLLKLEIDKKKSFLNQESQIELLAKFDINRLSINDDQKKELLESQLNSSLTFQKLIELLNNFGLNQEDINKIKIEIKTNELSQIGIRKKEVNELLSAKASSNTLELFKIFEAQLANELHKNDILDDLKKTIVLEKNNKEFIKEAKLTFSSSIDHDKKLSLERVEFSEILTHQLKEGEGETIEAWNHANQIIQSKAILNKNTINHDFENTFNEVYHTLKKGLSPKNEELIPLYRQYKYKQRAMKDFYKELNTKINKRMSGILNPEYDPISIANFAIQGIKTIQPIDGEANEMMARLMGDYVLQLFGLPPAILPKEFPDISVSFFHPLDKTLSEESKEYSMQSSYFDLLEGVKRSLELLKNTKNESKTSVIDTHITKIQKYFKYYNIQSNMVYPKEMEEVFKTQLNPEVYKEIPLMDREDWLRNFSKAVCRDIVELGLDPLRPEEVTKRMTPEELEKSLSSFQTNTQSFSLYISPKIEDKIAMEKSIRTDILQSLRIHLILGAIGNKKRWISDLLKKYHLNDDWKEELNKTIPEEKKHLFFNNEFKSTLEFIPNVSYIIAMNQDRSPVKLYILPFKPSFETGLGKGGYQAVFLTDVFEINSRLFQVFDDDYNPLIARVEKKDPKALEVGLDKRLEPFIEKGVEQHQNIYSQLKNENKNRLQGMAEPPQVMSTSLSGDNALILTQVLYDSDLEKALKNNDLNFPQIMNVFDDIAHFLDFLHNRTGVVHSDIKIENIFIKDKKGYLADFGFAKSGGLFNIITKEQDLEQIQDKYKISDRFNRGIGYVVKKELVNYALPWNDTYGLLSSLMNLFFIKARHDVLSKVSHPMTMEDVMEVVNIFFNDTIDNSEKETHYKKWISTKMSIPIVESNIMNSPYRKLLSTLRLAYKKEAEKNGTSFTEFLTTYDTTQLDPEIKKTLDKIAQEDQIIRDIGHTFIDATKREITFAQNMTKDTQKILDSEDKDLIEALRKSNQNFPLNIHDYIDKFEEWKKVLPQE